MSQRRTLTLNPGAQYDFVHNDHRHSAYMGGVGAGKTHANCMRGLLYSQQPTVPGEFPPKGCFLTISEPVLHDVVYPVMKKILEQTGMPYKYKVKDRTFVLNNGAEILMRSLEYPDRIRGIEIAWFGIDEGRNFKDDEAYTIMTGRLRQGVGEIEQDHWEPGQNYKQAGWVVSTPHGYDWMWQGFHPESPHTLGDVAWYNAPTHDNARNLPREYIQDLEDRWQGRWYDQEVLGKFVGVMSGAVFQSFDDDRNIAEVEYREDLPLYSFWDFGIGDPGVCIFAQLEYIARERFDGSTGYYPVLYILDMIEEKDKTTAEWAEMYHRWLEKNTGGRLCTASYGDPAGTQRGMTGTSAIAALNASDVNVQPAPRRPIDEGVLLLDNLMEDGRFIVHPKNDRLVQAIHTHHWSLDNQGIKKSERPVHDWTSHICDPLRYGAVSLLSFRPRIVGAPGSSPGPGTMGHIMGQLDRGRVTTMGQPVPAIQWHPDEQIRGMRAR